MATFHSIDNIKIGGNQSGRLKSDGVEYAIVSADYQQSYSESPSTLSMTVVSPDSSIELIEYVGGNRQSAPFSLNNLETIRIGNFTFQGFLSFYSESISAGQRLYQLKFIDRSVILDKIFVGLTNRHKVIKNPVGGSVDVGAFCGKNGQYRPATLSFGSAGGVGPKLNTSVNSGNSYTPFHGKEPFAGGQITVGCEQFTENFCSIPEVDYSFFDLINAIDRVPITIDSNDLAGIQSTNGIRRAYTGSLRSVLSSWCADFGYSYIWNESDGGKGGLGIMFFDMRTGLRNIKALRDSYLSKGIDSLEFSEDRGKTQANGLVTRLMRPHSISESTINFSRRIPCSPVTVSSLSEFTSKIRRPLVRNSFLTSCCLAKYNSDIRTLWYLSHSKDFLGMKWEALGIYIIKQMSTTNDKNGDAHLRAFYLEDYQRINEEWNGDYDVHLVYQSEDMASRHLNWEQDIAENFIGRYFDTTTFGMVPDQTNCDAIVGKRLKIADSNPPFIPYGKTAIPEIQNTPYGDKIGRTLEAKVKWMKTIERVAPWGGDSKGDAPFEEGGKQQGLGLKDLTPRFVPVTAEAYDELVYAKVIDNEHLENFSMGGAKFQMGLLFVRRKLSDVVKISSKSANNNNEVIDLEVNPNDPRDRDDTSHCTPKCSIDLATFICGSDTMNGSGLEPAPVSRTAFSVSCVIAGKNYGTIVAPVGARNGETFFRIETVNFKDFLGQKAIIEISNTLRERNPDEMLRAASVDIVEDDMTSKVLFTSDEKDSKILSGISYIIRNGQGERLGDVSGNAKKVLDNYIAQTAKSFSTGTTAPEQVLQVTFPAGFNLLDTIGSHSPKDGVSDVSYSLSSGGAQIKMTFRNMPPKYPQKDTILRQIKTQTRHYRN